MSEKISITKAAKSLVSPLSWFKSLMIGIKIMILVSAILGISFMVKKAKENKNTIIAQQGSNVTINQKEENNLFTEIFGQLDTSGEVEGGVRCGIRF